MLYLVWDREINISLFLCDVFVWKWGPRPRTSCRCYHGNRSAATYKKGIFVHLPWVPNCMQNLKGDWKFSFPKMFDSYRDLFFVTTFKILKKNQNPKKLWHIICHLAPAKCSRLPNYLTIDCKNYQDYYEVANLFREHSAMPLPLFS